MERTDRAPGRRRRRGAVAGTALAVGALVLGIGAVRLLASGDRPEAGDSARLADGSPLPADAPGLDRGSIDRGSIGRADVAGCLAPDFATDPALVTVLYGVRQKTPDGSVPVLILRNRAGRIRLCDEFGGDYLAQLPPERATAANPVAFYSTGRRDWNCEQRTQKLRRFTMTEWLSTSAPVHTVRLRFVVDGTPGAWFATRAANGFAHLQAWLDGPLPRGTRLAVQQEVLDATGAPVAQTMLPAGQRLPGCTAGSVQIG